MLAQQDSDRISLLAASAAGDPDANLVVDALVLEELRDNLLLQRLKSCSIAKEIGNANQEVAKQSIEFVGLLLQFLGIILHSCRLDPLHSPLDTALKSPLLVFAEIMPGARAQQGQDRNQRVLWGFGLEDTPIADIVDNPLGNRLDGQFQIEDARCHRTRRHL